MRLNFYTTIPATALGHLGFDWISHEQWSSCSSYPSSPSLPSSVSFATWASDSECCYPANWWGNNHVHHEHTLHLRNTWWRGAGKSCVAEDVACHILFHKVSIHPTSNLDPSSHVLSTCPFHFSMFNWPQNLGFPIRWLPGCVHTMRSFTAAIHQSLRCFKIATTRNGESKRQRSPKGGSWTVSKICRALMSTQATHEQLTIGVTMV